MRFIKRIEEMEINGSDNYYNFVILNTCEISEDQFHEFDGQF